MNLPRIIIDAVLFCPHCGANHVDEERNGEKWHRRAHTTHRCQACGGDFDVYVSGQAPLVPSPPKERAEDVPPAVSYIKDFLERSGIRGVQVQGDTLTFPMGPPPRAFVMHVFEVKK